MPRRALQCATRAGKPVQANADGPQTIAHNAKAGTPYLVTPSAGEPFRIVVLGRVRWALDRLRQAAERGCTPITEPAPRWSAYVHSLRELGLEIETIHESHGGDYPGYHARYVLCCAVALGRKGGTA